MLPLASTPKRPAPCVSAVKPLEVHRFQYSTSLKESSDYTASDAFFEALWDSGVQACFVNLGSDHPSLMEAIVKGQQERKDRFPDIYTCPNEMVALSMADGWARATGRPQAVIVHVDVGTQALGAAMHNANTGRAPVLIFAGICPYTEDGSVQGGRTEYQHWLQDIPDQKAIVAQYCRYVGELRTGSTVKQMVARAMQFAMSDPKGPVYLTGAREVMAEKIEPSNFDQEKNGPVQPTALPETAVKKIADALVHAKSPIVITGYSGRNHACPPLLVKLANSIPGLRFFDTGGSDMCFPASHPGYGGFRLGFDLATTEADLILILDCDVPWIPSRNPPRKDARIYHVDIDPLNSAIGTSFFPAHGRWRADSFTALTQLNQYLEGMPAFQRQLQSPIYETRRKLLQEKQKEKLDHISRLALPAPGGSLDIHCVGSAIRAAAPKDTIFVVEAATNAIPLSDQLQPSTPGSWLNSAGAGLGWSGGAALGVKLAHDKAGTPKFVCQIVGDATFLFSVPGSVYWIASRYNIPVLTIVLNNRGWNSPRRSYEFVHPEGRGMKASNRELCIEFDPPPNYAGIAKAAAGEKFGSRDEGLFVGKAATSEELEPLLREAVDAVLGGRGAVVEVMLDVDERGYSNIEK
ncbi:Benzoylformate decarboxylase [Lachnellula suecica]|uniref:Benzoylformate decarboxylase n=1 Tax=Lachnellula suecica TaxID=602035 RepID=A0A8T9CAS4_9HELO|nr:Benzoylformate decarboxylase [Lachnellula suecica]